MYYSERRVPTFVEAIHKAQRERKREDSEICESVTVKSAVVFMFRGKGRDFLSKGLFGCREDSTLAVLCFNLVWDLGGVSQNKSIFRNLINNFSFQNARKIICK
jgi:hypothetical protein